ncbi:hypothetical protein [Azospirillum doebereinerae]|uniref:hypothetical protein n=1 Tax=Azospirillum doebereinerae TaxID=92933 RepID=UPI001FD1447F|nr:hypothetical protein [Azospirillum doebereinerae]
MTATLQAALKVPETVVFTEHGTEAKPLPWQPPAVITETMRRDAVHALGALKVRSLPATQAEAEAFIAHLANLCAGKELPPASKLMGAVSSILRAEYPAAIINDPSTLDRVLKRVSVTGRPTWWPSWPELDAALDAERSALREQWRRLDVIAKGSSGTRALPPHDRPDDDLPPPTEAQQATVRDLLAAAGIALKSESHPLRR